MTLLFMHIEIYYHALSFSCCLLFVSQRHTKIKNDMDAGKRGHTMIWVWEGCTNPYVLIPVVGLWKPWIEWIFHSSQIYSPDTQEGRWSYKAQSQTLVTSYLQQNNLVGLACGDSRTNSHKSFYEISIVPEFSHVVSNTDSFFSQSWTLLMCRSVPRFYDSNNPAWYFQRQVSVTMEFSMVNLRFHV